LLTDPGSTLFFLGAGASRSYNFPTGIGLIESICQFLYKEHAVSKLCNAFGVDNSKMQNLVESFTNDLHSASSIDDLLGRNSSYVDIGKFCIVESITQYEQKESFGFIKNLPGSIKYNSTWYTMLWNQMYGEAFTIQDLLKNKISFVTFNYDRSLEAFLIKSAMSLFGKDQEAAANVIREIPIYHVYGKLGKLPWQAGNEIEIEYNPIQLNSLEKIVAASKCIKTYTESLNNTELSGNIFQKIKDSKNIYFIGCGYHSQNFKVLDPNEIFKGNIQDISQKHIGGTVMGLGEAQVAKAKKQVCNFLGLTENFTELPKLVDQNAEDFFKNIARIW
jgi:hypothetical protein